LQTEDFTKTKNIKTAIIIPARNEAQNLPALLKSLFEQDYPKELLEIIIVDDHSKDMTVEIAENYFKKNKITQGKILRSPDHSKKQAITFAISQTDAEFRCRYDEGKKLDFLSRRRIFRSWIFIHLRTFKSCK
jgi:glycosyltransferase involved in cell wall biosynthesis